MGIAVVEGVWVAIMGGATGHRYQLEIRGIAMSIHAIGKQERRWAMMLAERPRARATRIDVELDGTLGLTGIVLAA